MIVSPSPGVHKPFRESDTHTHIYIQVSFIYVSLKIFRDGVYGGGGGTHLKDTYLIPVGGVNLVFEASMVQDYILASHTSGSTRYRQ
jgi:hypothetical protein